MHFMNIKNNEILRNEKAAFDISPPGLSLIKACQ
jgi:hypothetical protein